MSIFPWPSLDFTRKLNELILIASKGPFNYFGNQYVGAFWLLHDAKHIGSIYGQSAYVFHSRKLRIFATFSALLYITPQIGGHLADQFFGKKYMISLGGLLLSAGYFLLSLPGEIYFYCGLSTIIIGSGFFVPNISGILGELYHENDARREGGFSILYSAINFGAFIPPLISAGLIARFGWHTAFAVAGFGVLVGVIIFNIGLLGITQLREKNNPCLGKNQFLLVIAIPIGILLFSSFIKHAYLANIFLVFSSGCLVIYIIKQSFKFPLQQRNRLMLSFILTIFSILFWALYAQGAMSLTLFAEYNVNRQTNWGLIPTMMFLALSPLYIILLGPLFARIWLWLGTKNLNLSIPVKFALATIFMGLGFAILPFSIWLQSTTVQIHFGWIVLSYFLQSVGELLIAPVGLSMMTTLAPKKMIGVMMGTWYLAMAVANILAGLISKSTVAASDITTSLISYMQIFQMVGSGAIFAGGMILLVSPYLNKLIPVKLPDLQLY